MQAYRELTVELVRRPESIGSTRFNRVSLRVSRFPSYG